MGQPGPGTGRPQARRARDSCSTGSPKALQGMREAYGPIAANTARASNSRWAITSACAR